MTVKELSEVCGVSQNSIRKWLIRHNTPKQLNTHTQQLEYVIGEETEKTIIQHYKDKANGVPNNCTPTTKQPHTHNQTTENDAVIELLKQQLDIISSQLTAKDKQIEQQQQTIQSLTAQLERVTEQLTTAQQLNAGSTQALLNLTKRDEVQTDATEQVEPQEQQPEKKKGFFSRLFGKR